MKVTVRTLDSKSNTFDIGEEATVKDFKEKIAPVLNLPVERQRIIFKGKVLHDDKLMKEYKVDGCVVHLVERQPPSSTEASSNETRTSNTSSQQTQNGNPSNVFIGAFQGSGDEMNNVTQQIVESLMSSLGGGHGAATVSTTSMGDATAVNVQINMQSNDQHGQVSDVQIRLRQAQKFIALARNRVENMTASEAASDDINGNTLQQQNDRPSAASRGETNIFELTNSPQSFARVIRNFQELYSQLEPSLTRYRNLLDNPQSEERIASDDSLPDSIADILHNMSHALHALSDVTFNFQSPDPQTVSCLPRINPVSVPPHLHPNPRPANSSESSQTSTTSNASSVGGQPHFHPSPHLHFHVSQTSSNTATTTNSMPQQSQPIRPPVFPQSFAISRPIGVSATVIQIPSQGRGMSFPQPQQPTNPSTIPTNSAATNTNPQATRSSSSGVPLFPSNVFTQGSFSPVNFSNILNNAPQASSGAQSTSTTQTRSRTNQRGPGVQLPRFPFNLDPLNPSSMAGHPDPSVPCQSFHFGPRFQQAGDGNGRPHIVAEVSSVVIEHVRNVTPSTLNAGAQGTGQTEVTSATANLLGSTHQHMPQSFQTSAQGHTSTGGTQQRFAATNSDQLTIDASRIYQEIQRAMNQAMTNEAGESPTIRNIAMEAMGGNEDSEDIEPSDFIFHFINYMSEYMTITDLVQIFVGGSYEPLRRLAPHAKEYIESKFTNGERLSLSNIPKVVDEIMKMGVNTEDVLGSLSVRDNVDLQETVNEIDREMFLDMLFALSEYDGDSFGDEMARLFYKYLAWLFGVLDFCVEGRSEAYLHAQLSSERTSRMLDSLGPSIRPLFTDMVVNKLRHAASQGQQLTEQEIKEKLIMKREKKHEASASEVNGACRGDAVHEEQMDIDQKWNEFYGTINTDQQSDDEVPYSPSEFQEWHRHVPPEWISVITRDTKRQRSESHQRPFSDAYNSGLPAKRRRAVRPQNEKQIDFKMAVHNSIKSASVKPVTSNAELLKDLEAEDLEVSFQERFKKDAKERLEKDPDYKPGRFPKSDEYFFPEK